MIAIVAALPVGRNKFAELDFEGAGECGSRPNPGLAPTELEMRNAGLAQPCLPSELFLRPAPRQSGHVQSLREIQIVHWVDWAISGQDSIKCPVRRPATEARLS